MSSDDGSSDQLNTAKERAWLEIGAINAAHARGEIDDARWHQEMARLVVPAYLSAATPQGGSGHSGTADEWAWSRGVVAEAIDRSGTFLDVGCANGLLMESITEWSAKAGFELSPHGIDIAPELADLARHRLPHWSERIFVGNALGWRPPFRFNLVRTGLEYVPLGRRRELVAWLLDEVVAPGGRLIIGKFNEETDHHVVEEKLNCWGFVVTGRAERAHRTEQQLVYRVIWIDSHQVTD
jgi:SAM-dependent methyltransferase